jgi:hypothetical protein
MRDVAIHAENLSKQYRIVSPGDHHDTLAESMAHAAAVCLESQRHLPGVSLEVRGNSEASFDLSWLQTTDQVRRTWNDETEATEYGACAVAVLLVLKLTEWTVIERSWEGTGFDYWLGEQRGVLFQRRACLEVSGIRRGNDSDVRRRVEGTPHCRRYRRPSR